MKTNNYYDTLSKVQKQKWAEKQGNLCYYEWFDTLYEEYTLEETGAIFLSLMFYDRTGGTQPLPKDLETEQPEHFLLPIWKKRRLNNTLPQRCRIYPRRTAHYP